MVGAAQAPSVRGVELRFWRVLPLLLMVGDHAVPRRSLVAALTVRVDPLAAPSGAIAGGFAPCAVLRAEVMRVGLLRLRLDRPDIQGGDSGTQRVQPRHRSRRVVRRGLEWGRRIALGPLRASEVTSHFLVQCLQQSKPLIAKPFRSGGYLVRAHLPCRFRLTGFVSEHPIRLSSLRVFAKGSRPIPASQ